MYRNKIILSGMLLTVVLVFSSIFIYLHEKQDTLPIILENDIDEVYFIDYYKPNKSVELDRNNILEYYNDIEVSRSDIGTTADCCIKIILYDNDELIIEPMYFNNQISIQIYENDNVSVLNAKSSEFTKLFDDLSK